MCGMEESTVNLLMANIAYKLGKVDIASRFISMILTSQAASSSGKRPSDAFKRRDYCKTARQRIIYGWKILCGKKGKVPGIYTSWDACKSMVHGFRELSIKGLRHAQKRNSFWKKKRGTKGTGKLCVCRRFV